MLPPLVHTELGILRGLAGPASESFLGVPYAVPPLRELRFAPPKEWTQRWEGTRNATQYGSPCHQSTGYWEVDPSEHPGPSAPAPDEDCLFLNVFRPSGRTNPPSLLPTMVWIHGGGFCGGTGSSAWDHGQSLARAGVVVVVSLNYRLGPLGFLCHPELKARYGASGGANGLADQIVALQWVQHHIRAFGGDPSQVTIFGESSGGVSVCVLNASPRARGLFRRAIVQSGPCIVESEGWGPGTAKAGYALGASLASALNATSLDALRALPPQALQWDNATLNSDTFSGYFLDDSEADGVLPTPPREVYASGGMHAEALVIGHTSFDGTAAFYATAPLANATPAEWDARMRARFRPHASAVQAQYPLTRYTGKGYPAVPASYIAADSDERVACPTAALARLAARSAPGRVFSYVFAHMQTNCDASFALHVLPWREPARSALAGSGWASHGADVKFVFNTVGAHFLSRRRRHRHCRCRLVRAQRPACSRGCARRSVSPRASPPFAHHACLVPHASHSSPSRPSRPSGPSRPSRPSRPSAVRPSVRPSGCWSLWCMAAHLSQTHGPSNLLPFVEPGDGVARQDCPSLPSEGRLAAEMMHRWTRFARGEEPWDPFVEPRACAASVAPTTPGGSRGCTWAAGATTRTLRLRTDDEGGSTIVSDFKVADCRFWQSHA